ncbi:hypothetical protein D9M71_528200 [compost metagenome]
MIGQVRKLAVQAVVAARAQPVRRVLAIAARWPQVELDGQFLVMHAFSIAQQNIQLAQGVAARADR